MCSVKNVFLEISQNSQENTCDRVSFLIKLPGLSQSGKVSDKRVFFTMVRESQGKSGNVFQAPMKVRESQGEFFSV